MRDARCGACVLVLLCAGCESLSYLRPGDRRPSSSLIAARPIDDWLADPATPRTLAAALETARRHPPVRFARAAPARQRAATRLMPISTAPSRCGTCSPRRSSPSIRSPSASPSLAASPTAASSPRRTRARYAGEAARRRATTSTSAACSPYSTLGWFDDPLLSTFIRYPDAQVARLVFHELAHQLVYAKDDTTFNESFAVDGRGGGRAALARGRGRAGRARRVPRGAGAQARSRRAHQGDARAAEARLRSEPHRGADAASRSAASSIACAARFPQFVPAEPNNAFLVSIALYNELVPAFERAARRNRRASTSSTRGCASSRARPSRARCAAASLR